MLNPPPPDHGEGMNLRVRPRVKKLLIKQPII